MSSVNNLDFWEQIGEIYETPKKSNSEAKLEQEKQKLFEIYKKHRNELKTYLIEKYPEEFI